jgi:hypothetical protein
MAALEIAYTASSTFQNVHQDPSFVRGVRGPVGSGKSVGCILDVFSKALQQKPNRNGFRKTRWALVRASYPELKSTTIKTFQDWIPETLCPLKMNEAPITGLMTLPLPDKTIVQAEFLFIALDKPKDLAKLLSLELTGAFCNESKELNKEVIDTITSRVGRYPSQREGGPTWNGVIMDTNSPSEQHWWAEMERDPPRGWSFHAQPPAMFEDSEHEYGYAPNPDAENIKNLPGGYQYYYNAIGGKDKNWIRAYVLNQFAATMVGKPIYQDQWSEQLHLSKHKLYPMVGQPVIVGLDFGLTPAAIFTQLIDGQLRVLDEVIAKRMGLEQFLVNDLLPLIGQKYFDNDVFFVGDPSGTRGADTDEKSCFDVLVKFGLPAVPAHSNNLEPRLGAVRHFLTSLAPGGKPGILVSPHCRDIAEGFNGGYQFARIQVSGESRFREKPDKNRYSHPHDALQYACMRWTILLKRSMQGDMVATSGGSTIADSATGY